MLVPNKNKLYCSVPHHSCVTRLGTVISNNDTKSGLDTPYFQKVGGAGEAGGEDNGGRIGGLRSTSVQNSMENEPIMVSPSPTKTALLLFAAASK